MTLSHGDVQSLLKRNLLHWVLIRKLTTSFEDFWCFCSGGFFLSLKVECVLYAMGPAPKPPSAKNLPPQALWPGPPGSQHGSFRSLSPLPGTRLMASQCSLSRKHRVPKSQQTVSPWRLWQRAQPCVCPAISGISLGPRARRLLLALPGPGARRRSCPP